MSTTNVSHTTTQRLALIVPAAGSSTRIGGDIHKPFIELLGLPVICHTLRRFQGIRGLEQIIIVAHPDNLQHIKASYWLQMRQLGATNLVAGGAQRQDSVACGLETLHKDIGIVLIHDAVRPLVPRRAIDETINAAAQHGAAVVAVPVADTVKRSSGEATVETVPRDDLWIAQTPQVFQVKLLRKAIAAAVENGYKCTDDAQLVERLDIEVRLVRGSCENFKITTPEHLQMAEALLARARIK